jgi:hypothetical protein
MVDGDVEVTGGGRRRRLRRGALAAVLALPTVVGLWAFVLWATARPLPAPLWTDADLPAPPPREQNGWVALSPSVVGAVPHGDGATAKVLALRAEDPAPRLARVAAQRPAIDGLLDTPAAREKLAAFEHAVELPRFADACAPAVEADCHLLARYNVERLAMLEALRHGADGRWGQGLTLAARTARADLDLAASTRSLVSHLLALSLLPQSLDVTVALLGAHKQANAAPLDGAAIDALRSLSRSLAAFDPEQLSARRGVIAEYLMMRRVLVTGEGIDETFGRAPASILLDRGATQLELDRVASAAMAAALGKAPPPRPDETLPALWWLHNPMGKQLLFEARLDWAGVLAKVAAKRAVIDGLRREASQELVGL